jgi:hypothetical protein
MADRSNFWKMVDRTKPSKLRVFAENELQDCEDYFLEIQSDSTLPPNEIITASERLALIRSEIDLRHSDAKHRQTQRLARWAIAFEWFPWLQQLPLELPNFSHTSKLARLGLRL